MADKVNAPPCISHLHGDERRAALMRRHSERKAAYEAVFERNGLSRWQLFIRALRGIVGKE